MTRKNTKMLPQRVHRAYLLREAEHFREHKKGVPEWIKNSDDSYSRHEEVNKKNFSDCPILINFSKNEINCLDFGGANSKDMIEHIPYYGSPTAATQGKTITKNKVSGGHGNGGKYYALSQFEECVIISYYLGKLTVLRINEIGDYEDYNNIACDPLKAINFIGLNSWQYFSENKEGRKIYGKIKDGKIDLFCWKGINPKDKKNIFNPRSLKKLLLSIIDNPQSRSALRCRVVNALFNGRLIWASMKPDEVVVDESFGIREFSLPNEIGGNKFNNYFNSVLRVTLSKEPLTGDKSSHNILEIDAFKKNIAYYDIPQLLIDKSLSKNLYAYIDCPELREYKCVSNERVHLIEGEISTLFLDWCKAKLREVLEELTSKEKKKEEKKHLGELDSFLKEITNEISHLLEEENIITPVSNPEGAKIELSEVPTNLPGYGFEKKIKNKGKGQRLGGKEIKEGPTSEKKNKSKLQILISNYHDDPLNPGKKFDMIEREPVLFQRAEDIDYGLWWINSQKNYIKKINILDPGAAHFYFFLVKEIVLSHKIRRRFREQERYDPDGLDELNLQIIDEIFNKVVQRLGLELSFDLSIADKIRTAIKNKDKFTIPELSKELMIDPPIINAIIKDKSNGVLDNYSVTRENRGKGPATNVYVRK